MYEEMTYETILKRLLSRVNSSLDQREGSIIYDALAPAAAELAQAYIDLDVTLNETFADTASREYLVKRAAERGITPTPASAAVVKGVFHTAAPIGARFRLNQYTYIVTEVLSESEHSYKLTCETAGAGPNSFTGPLIPLTYIDGLSSAELTEILIPGEDAEETEVFRKRFLNSFHSQAFGGNIADYKEKVTGIPGIGGVKVYPAWNGGGTVKLVILSSTFDSPTETQVTEVQTLIDPVQNQGTGLGLAPIGHVVTVTGVTETTVSITTQITYSPGWNWEELRPAAEAAIDKYFSELNRTWAENERIIVRISQLESRLLELEGVTDIAHTALNAAEENFQADPDAIVKRGTIYA